MSKRTPSTKSTPKRPADSSAIELGAGQILAVLAFITLIAGAFWWMRSRGNATTATQSAAIPTSVPSTSASPGTSSTPDGPSGAASGTQASISATIFAGDPDTGAWTTPEGHPALGAEDAPVTIVVYSDYQCPNCRQFATEVIPWLRQTWLAKRFVRLIYRDFVLRGEGSQRAAEAAQCASQQGHFWRYHDLLFERQASEESVTAFPNAQLLELAGLVGLDAKAFETCLAEHKFRDRVSESTKTATDQRFSGTPTFLVNGRRTQGAIPVAQWDELFGLFQNELGGGAKP